MRSYDMEGVLMKRRGRNLSLKVPGLVEKRPSLVQGDYIFARHAGSDTQPYQVSPLSLTFQFSRAHGVLKHHLYVLMLSVIFLI